MLAKPTDALLQKFAAAFDAEIPGLFSGVGAPEIVDTNRWYNGRVPFWRIECQVKTWRMGDDGDYYPLDKEQETALAALGKKFGLKCRVDPIEKGWFVVQYDLWF